MSGVQGPKAPGGSRAEPWWGPGGKAQGTPGT